jgi:hemerythrin superfamily protein
VVASYAVSPSTGVARASDAAAPAVAATMPTVRASTVGSIRAIDPRLARVNRRPTWAPISAREVQQRKHHAEHDRDHDDEGERDATGRSDRVIAASLEAGRLGTGTFVTDTSIDLGRPIQGDVVELILADHRRFETLLRDLRDSSSDRDAVRHAFATLHTAHALAEERHVYPKLRTQHAVTEHEAEHGEEEHAEGHEALLALLELKGTDTQAFDDAVEELARVVNHHLTEEELTILNPARDEVAERARSELGEAFATERNRQIDDGCGTLTHVRRLVAEARRDGLLDEDDED